LEGYEVVTANDGFEALELVKQDDFAVVLMDVKMPVMDGVETYKRVKEIAPDVPVIMITAFSVEELIKDALRQGAYGSVRKPLDFNKLFKLIEKAINGMLVLVIDDDDNLCTSIRDTLTDKSYRVCTANDGETAIQRAWENNFDVMLIDLKLPVLNGLETYLKIRKIRPNLVAIIITGYPVQMSDLIAKALLKGAYDCLEKPIDMDRLLLLLEQIEERRTKDTPG
jgi:DNA-binding NtrC family response regulator